MIKHLLFILLIGITFPIYSQTSNESRFDKVTLQNMKAVLDTFKYTKADFEFMISEMKSDSTLMGRLESRISEGDTIAVKFKKILYTSYDNRLTTQLTDDDIKGLVFSFYMSRRIMMKFKELDESLKISE